MLDINAGGGISLLELERGLQRMDIPDVDIKALGTELRLESGMVVPFFGVRYGCFSCRRFSGIGTAINGMAQGIQKGSHAIGSACVIRGK